MNNGYKPKGGTIGSQPNRGSYTVKEIYLKKRSYEEIRDLLIEKTFEIETLYFNNFQNCKHRSGWCKDPKNCKTCEFMK